MPAYVIHLKLIGQSARDELRARQNLEAPIAMAGEAGPLPRSYNHHDHHDLIPSRARKPARRPARSLTTPPA
jgi:hypothetical protein